MAGARCDMESTNDLAQRDCVPCRGGVPPLGDAQIAALLSQLRGPWRVADISDAQRGSIKTLSASYAFTDFAHALDAAVRIGAIAEAQRHHPDLHVAWGRLGVAVWTHKIGGLTESDFVFAAKCDALLLHYS